MLYLIGLGLNKESITYQSSNAIKNSRAIYLENYTITLPYEKEELQEIIQKRIKEADREFVESFEILKEAKEKNTALLIYGAPLIATTHISLIQEANKRQIPTKIIQNASIMDGVSETGLQLYKFGKITSIPNFQATSFADTIKQNISIQAHTLILTDIGLTIQEAIQKLIQATKEKDINLNKIIVCSKIGTPQSQILYRTPEQLEEHQINQPYCIIIPAELHFTEENFLKQYENP